MSFVSESINKLSSWVMKPQHKKTMYSLSEGSLQDESFLSRKAATLCELHRLGFSIPPAFIISSDVSMDFYHSGGHKFDDNFMPDLKAAIDSLGSSIGRVYGSTSGPPPLLLSVRGGALVSPNTDVSFEESIDSINTDIVDILGAPDSWCIPGVKESCLGIGMNDRVAEHLANITTPFLAYNTYAHFLVRFGTIVQGAQRRHYRRILTEHVQNTGRAGVNLTKEDLMHIVHQFKLIADVPDDPYVQMQLTIQEMYRCWFSPSAMAFRSEAMNIARNTGTAVIVQSIVFGGTGVCFTRSPITGEQGRGVFGTYWAKSGEKITLDEHFGSRDEAAFRKLVETSRNLELHFKDMQQFEFVYNNEDDLLYILQVQSGRRTPRASMKIAVDMVDQRMVTEREALLRLDASKASYFMQRHLHPDQLESVPPIGSGLSASRGVVTAPIVFTSAECMERSLRGDVILCLHEAFPIDARALRAASGVITMSGSIFSNAAVLCRGMGKPCITTVRDMSLTLHGDDHQLSSSSTGDSVHPGDIVTMDGGSGRIFQAIVGTVSSTGDMDFQTVLQWADKFRQLRVEATITSNSDMHDQVTWAKEAGADAIGCLSTDDMFWSTMDRLSLFRTIIIHRAHADKLDPIRALGTLHKNDFKTLFRSCGARKVVVKLLDAPLCQYLPASQSEVADFANRINISATDIEHAIAITKDRNPDIGLRGSRITAYYPEITEMQIRSIISAALDLRVESIEITPRILLPMLCSSHEVEAITSLISRVTYEVFNEYTEKHPSLQGLGQYYEIGAVFNSPRACLRAQTIAPHVAFAAFSMNDITALTFGCERSDAEKFFPHYIFDKIYLADPFRSLDDAAVGTLLSSGLQKCHDAKSNMECTILDGDHTSDPRSIDFFSEYGAQTLCCPVKRVPIARIAAAQTAIKASNKGDLEELTAADIYWMF